MMLKRKDMSEHREKPAAGWVGRDRELWNIMLDAGMTVSDADEFVGSPVGQRIVARFADHAPGCLNVAPSGAPIGLDEEREYDRLSDRLRDSGLPELECAEGQSCGSLNALRALLDQVQTLRDWKESALQLLARWHALGDVLQKLWPLPPGVDIPTALKKRAESAEQELTTLRAKVEALEQEPGK